MDIKINSYFDITCDHCGFSRSTDFGHGFETNAKRLRALAHNEGWKYTQGETLCPDCMSSPRIVKGACYANCPHFSSCQEEYDDEPLAFCTKAGRQLLGSLDDVYAGECTCIMK